MMSRATRGADVKQCLYPLDPGDFLRNKRGKGRTCTAAKLPKLREYQTVDLSHDPGADRKMGAAEARHDKGRGECQVGGLSHDDAIHAKIAADRAIERTTSSPELTPTRICTSTP
jgi:hypothetical protein